MRRKKEEVMKIAYIMIFVFGFMSGIAINQITKPAKAEVAGMDAYDLKTDYDFKKAVKSIVEDNCHVYNDSIQCW